MQAGPREEGARGKRSRARKWWAQHKNLDPPPARKQNCAVDSRGHMEGKWDFKMGFGCQGRGAEGIQSRKEKLGRPEVLSCGPDCGCSQGQNAQREAGLSFGYFKGRMFMGHSRKRRD